MDVCDHQHQHRHGRHRKQSPSFSSSLLDAIYRSIDDTDQTMRKKQSFDDFEHHDRFNFRRACMIEKWMEKKKKLTTEKQRASMADFDRNARNVRDHRDRGFKNLINNSSSSSSESSTSGSGGFSSSESESMTRPFRMENHIQVSIPIQNHENGFVKTKSKALKIYGDLKKAKQPVSPGGRLATFLNSIFNAGSPKKHKFTNSSDQSCMRKSKSAQASTCSSASSFSRSCLSKAPSSSGAEKLKRSVRFCPVSVIVDEDSRPCGHKSLRDELGLMAAAAAITRRTDYCRTAEEGTKINDDDNDDDDDEDAMSCSSSDLFELDNLSSIGIERFCEELPVYETTHFTTNKAIANGFIL